VLPFVSHADELVRRLALTYLAEAHDPAPVTADDLWRAVDGMASDEARLSVIHDIPALPQTDGSVTRLLAELDETPPGRAREELEYIVAALDGAVLRRHRDRILDNRALPKDVRRRLRERVELSDLPGEAAWDRLMALAADVADQAMSEFAGSAYRGLLDAAERHPALAERAAAMLADPDVTDWREVFAADVLGRLRHAPATELLVRKIAADDDEDVGGDAITDIAVGALVRIGTVAAVDAVAAAFGSMAWGPRLSAADVLRRIKRPESEAAVVRLLADETDQTNRTQLAAALCHLCPTDPRAFEVLRPMTDARAFDVTMLDLEEDVLAAAVIAGADLPEAQRWRDRLGDKAARGAQRMRAFREVLSDDTVDLLGGGGGLLADNEPIAPPPPAAALARESSKVGRNEPCPCGSGKKYKKCCGR
jgi:hypothetical protein